MVIIPENDDHRILERTKKISGWHILTMIEIILSVILSVFLIFTNVSYYVNEDFMVESCTTSDISGSFYVCHYLSMILTLFFNDQGSGKAEDYKMGLQWIYLITLVSGVHYALSAVIAMAGVVANKRVALIPWLVALIMTSSVLTFLIVIEVYVDHHNIKDLIYVTAGSRGDPEVASKFFLMALALLTFEVFKWITAFITFNYIRRLGQVTEDINRFQYGRLPH